MSPVGAWAPVTFAENAPYSSYGLDTAPFAGYGRVTTSLGVRGAAMPAPAASEPQVAAETSIIAALTPVEPASAAPPSPAASAAPMMRPVSASAAVQNVTGTSMAAPAQSTPALKQVAQVKPRVPVAAVKAALGKSEQPGGDTGTSSVPNFVLPPAAAVAAAPVPSPSPSAPSTSARPASSASLKAEDAGIRSPVVLAKAADGVFVRINEKTTLQVKKGSSVPGLGALISIDADGAHFEHATVPSAK